MFLTLQQSAEELQGPQSQLFRPPSIRTSGYIERTLFFKNKLVLVLQSSKVEEMLFAVLLSLTAFIAASAMSVPSSVGVLDCLTICRLHDGLPAIFGMHQTDDALRNSVATE